MAMSTTPTTIASQAKSWSRVTPLAKQQAIHQREGDVKDLRKRGQMPAEMPSASE